MTRLLLLALLALPLSAQMMDPDPREPEAYEKAEHRYRYSLIGMATPPVGWHCESVFIRQLGPVNVFDAECRPDEALIEQQEREYCEWMERLSDRLRRHGRRR